MEMFIPVIVSAWVTAGAAGWVANVSQLRGWDNLDAYDCMMLFCAMLLGPVALIKSRR